MIELEITTTQNVNIKFIAASLGERILAFLIDMILIVTYLISIFYVLGEIGLLNVQDKWSKFAIMFTASLPALLYTLVSEIFMQGQTLGKKALRIKVVKLDGYQASILDFISRWLFRIVDIYLGFGTGGIAIISIAMTKNSQRIGDLAAGTAVISLKNKYHINHTILEEIDDDYQPVFPQVIHLTDKDMQIIKDTFNSALQNRDFKLMIKLRLKVEEITQTSRGNRTDEAYIRNIMRDYSFFTQNM